MREYIFAPQKIVLDTRVFKHFFYLGILFSLIFQLPAPAQSKIIPGNAEKKEAHVSTLSLPSVYGKVIYRYNETAPNKLYIVGISHRDSRTRLNGDNTAKTQIEVYNIGEWLNHYQKLNLLLPEGFFNTSSSQADIHFLLPYQDFDDKNLEKILADNSHFVNAEMLLMQHLHMRAYQIENQQLYAAILSRVIRLETSHDNPAASLSLEVQIRRLQEERTAAMLQNIPVAVETEYKKGSIKNKNALFTIGLNHIATIISYLNKEKKIAQTDRSSSSSDGNLSILNKKYKKYGVTVIIPRTLVQDQKVMKMTNLISLM